MSRSAFEHSPNVLSMEDINMNQTTGRMNPGKGPVCLISNYQRAQRFPQMGQLEVSIGTNDDLHDRSMQGLGIRDHEDIRLGWRVRRSARC